MADLADREGFSARIINYSVERLLDRHYSLLRHLKGNEPSVLGADLHWIHHSAGAIDALRLVKQRFPGTFTLLGGFSATHYAREILRDYQFVDGIIQGDGEVPLVELLKQVNGRQDFGEVPNLIYRDGERIVDNRITYVTTELDSFNFARLQFLDHWREYLQACEKLMHFSFSLEVARGCPFNCMFCGGARVSLKRLCNRSKTIFRSPHRVVDDIKELLDTSGDNGVYYGHGVYPATEAYFMEISRLLREEKLDIHADLEAWRLPVSRNFFRDFASTYQTDRSVIWFSNRSFSESYRRKMDGLVGNFDDSFHFTNRQFESFLQEAHRNGLAVQLFWDTNYPNETIIDSVKNIVGALRFFTKGLRQKARIAYWSESILVSPGSPVELAQEKFGLKVDTKTFADHVRLNLKRQMSLNPSDEVSNYRTNIMPRIAGFLVNKVMLPLNFFSFFPAFVVFKKSIKKPRNDGAEALNPNRNVGKR